MLALLQSAMTKTDKIQFLADLGEDTVYLMGMSFVLGSLFTILILMLLDFMRRNNPKT